MSWFGLHHGGPTACTCDGCTCDGCAARADTADAPMLPDGWDAFHAPGRGWLTFCAGCAADGGMEAARAVAAAPRRQHWAYPGGVVAVLKPRAGSVLLATPDGMAELSEVDATRLRDALAGALATRDLAAKMAAAAQALSWDEDVGCIQCRETPISCLSTQCPYRVGRFNHSPAPQSAMTGGRE